MPKRDLCVGTTVLADSTRRIHELLNQLVDGDKIMMTRYFPDVDTTFIIEGPVKLGRGEFIAFASGITVRFQDGMLMPSLKCITVSALVDEPDEAQELREQVQAAVMDVQDKLARVLDLVQKGGVTDAPVHGDDCREAG